MRYRRVLIPNTSYFFTINLQNRKSNLLIQKIDALRFSFIKVKKNHPFYIDAIVIMPNHLHMLITLPENDSNYATRISLIKSAFSRQIYTTELLSESRKNKRERGIWQRRYWEHVIRNDEDYKNHINYIHYNPVKHGFVQTPSQWEYSSIHPYIKKGFLSKEWACNDDFKLLGFGE